MAGAIRKLDLAPMRFPGRHDYAVSDAIYCTRKNRAKEMCGDQRYAAPEVTTAKIRVLDKGPRCVLDLTVKLVNAPLRIRGSGLFFPAIAAFWFHVALLVLMNNVSTIAKEVMPPVPLPEKEIPVEVTMNLTFPKPKPPPAAPALKAQLAQKAPPVAKPIPKAPPGPKFHTPKPAPVAASAPVRSAPQPKVAANEPAAGSPAASNAPVASTAKALDFLSGGKTMKDVKASATSGSGPSKNYDMMNNSGPSSKVATMKLGEGTGSGAAGPIRTGGKLIQGNGLGIGTGMGRGTGVQARVAAGQVHRGSGGGGPSGSIAIGGGVEASGPGSIAESEVMAALKRNMDKFRYCYEKALLRDGSLAGVVKMAWTVNTSGAASNPNAVSSEINSSELHNCISKTLTGMRFPPAKGGNVEVRFPFVFKASAY